MLEDCQYVNTLDQVRACTYELNKFDLDKNLDNAASSSIQYVVIVTIVYIVCVVLTILHETYKVTSFQLNLERLNPLNLSLSKKIMPKF